MDFCISREKKIKGGNIKVEVLEICYSSHNKKRCSCTSFLFPINAFYILLCIGSTD